MDILVNKLYNVISFTYIYYLIKIIKIIFLLICVYDMKKMNVLKKVVVAGRYSHVQETVLDVMVLYRPARTTWMVLYRPAR